MANVSVEIPTNRRIAVFGLDEANKQVLVRLLAGNMLPTSGDIIRKARLSFPLGHTGGFWPELSVRENVEYVARLYGADVPAVVRFVREVAKIGSEFERSYALTSRRSRALINMVLLYSIPFDAYLIDQSVARGDGYYKQISIALFEARIKTSGIIFTTRDTSAARMYCDMAAILHNGRLTLFDELERGIHVINQIKAAAPTQPQVE